MKISLTKNGTQALVIESAANVATRRTLLTPAINELGASMANAGTYTMTVVVSDEDAATVRAEIEKRTQAMRASPAGPASAGITPVGAPTAHEP